jgi:hypothetical protein
MKFLAVVPRAVLELDGVPIPQTVEMIVGGPYRMLSVRGPGHVRVYCAETAAPKEVELNTLATLFCRKNGVIPAREVIVGMMVVVGGDGAGGDAAVPRWVVEELTGLVPQARAIDGPRRRKAS